MKPILNLILKISIAGLLSFGAIASAMPEDKARLEAQETRLEAVQELQKVETKNEPPKEEKPLETPKEQPEKQNISKAPVQPEAQPPQPIAQTPSIAPVGITDRGGNGSCAAEIAKYPWNQSLATAVSTAESGMNPGIVNHNPSTQDYSVGCFQVNLWGDLAKSRPSEEQLRDAAVNVKWAYDNYIRNGHSFKGQWGVCGVKVDCDTGLTIRK
mgnify:CR=1 FL=1|jgi:hypothetical protein